MYDDREIGPALVLASSSLLLGFVGGGLIRAQLPILILVRHDLPASSPPVQMIMVPVQSNQGYSLGSAQTVVPSDTMYR
jgi:hypothetical protein